MTLAVSSGLMVDVFFNQDTKADVYLFYDHERFLDNIFYDISNLLYFVVSSYILSKYNKLFQPFFIISLVNVALYFIVYKQNIALIEYPILLILMTWRIRRSRL